jgi:hypothetical protein
MAKKIKLTEKNLVNIVGKIVSEQFNEDPNKFTTTIEGYQDVDVYGIEKVIPQLTGNFNYDFESLTVEVDWRYELDVRTWGIKDITLYTTQVRVEGSVNIWAEEGDGEIVEFSKVVDDMEGTSNNEGWVYQDEKDDIGLHTIKPQSIMVDFNEELVTVQW